MAEYRIRNTGEVLTEQQFLNKLKGASFEFPFTLQWLESQGVDVVFEGPQPTLTPPYEYSYRDGVQQINGTWHTKYSVGPAFVDKIESDGTVTSAASQEASYKAAMDNNAASQARVRRDLLLAESDFTQLKDVSLSNNNDWVTYRQALRDVPSQTGFPWNVQWPAKP